MDTLTIFNLVSDHIRALRQRSLR